MNVKELRIAHKITQQKLSDETGIPRTRIAQWELGNGAPKADDSKLLKAYFDSLKKSGTKELNKSTVNEHQITGLSLDEIKARAGRTEESEPTPHEGHILKAYIKGRGVVMEDFVEQKLKMTVQNFYNHLRKPVLNETFRLQIENTLGVDFYKDIMGESKKTIEHRIETESYRTLMLELFERIERLENKK